MSSNERRAQGAQHQEAEPGDIYSRPRDTSPGEHALLHHLRHELRTPVNHIIGYSELLLDEATEQDLGAFVPDLQRIHAAGTRLLELVTDFLDPSRTDAHTEDLAGLRTSAQEIIASGKLAQETAEGQGRQALIPDLQRIQAAAEHVLALADDIGLDPVRIEAGRMGPEPHPSGEAIASPDAGTTVESPVGTSAVRAERGGASLLVVDDDEMNRDMLSRRLARLGYSAARAENGRRALEMLKAEAFDVVLLDIVMPEMDGYAVLAHLKADHALRDIPVIVLSALDQIDSVVRCIELGAEEYLPRPFNPVLLQARIGACLEKKRLRDQEVLYLQQVARVTAAAAAVEADTFDPESLGEIAGRPDALGQLARVFQRMAREVYARQQRLKQQVQDLKIEIDQARRVREVAEITETEYFQQLRRKADELRGGLQSAETSN